MLTDARIIRPRTLRVLGAILTLAAEGKPVTYQRLSAELDINLNAVWNSVRRLMARGLVETEPGARQASPGTLRALCQFTPAERR